MTQITSQILYTRQHIKAFRMKRTRFKLFDQSASRVKHRSRKGVLPDFKRNMAETESEAVCAFCGDTETLRPSEIHFTREFIAPEFSDGIVIAKAVDAILDGKLPVEVFEPLKVHKRGDKWFTWYNQRLYLLRLLECRDFLDFVIVRMVDEESGSGGKEFKPLDGGETIKFRYEDILPHGPVDIESGPEEEDHDEEQDADIQIKDQADVKQKDETEQGFEEEPESETHDSATQTAAPKPNDGGLDFSTIAGEATNKINQILHHISDESNMLTFMAIAILIQVFLMYYFS